MRDVLNDALTTDYQGPKVVIAQSECMLNKQRRVKPQIAAAVNSGERVVKEKFGVDASVCSGDHACMRLSGCPSLTLKNRLILLPNQREMLLSLEDIEVASEMDFADRIVTQQE